MLNDSCGTCAMCCKLPKIDELAKPMGKWCDKCTPGKEGACSIFGQPERPAICGEYLCVWRQTDLAPELRPDRCGFILDASTTDPNMVRVLVDAARHDAYKKGPGGRMIQKLQERGVSVAIVAPDGFRRLLLAGDRSLVDGEAILAELLKKIA